MIFTIDPGILEAYRHRGVAATAALHRISDDLRSAKEERDELLMRGRKHIRDGLTVAEAPEDALHPEERNRLKALISDIERLQRSYDLAERDISYANPMATRVVAAATGRL